VAALALGGVVLWCVARPAYARWIWWNAPSSQQLASRVMRAEPWLSDPAEWWTMDLLRRERWMWESSAEAMYWSARAVEVHPGSARLWSQFGRVRGRIAQEIGPWEDVVEGARAGFRRACELEPRLPWYRLQWAQFERAMGERERALQLTQRALAEEPNFVRGWLLLARLQLDLGDRERAAESFKRAERAARLAGGRSLKGYERDLLAAPSFQVRELRRELSQPADGQSESPAGGIE
jgi:tetratricopeptide (TPR) repeat protein